MACERLTEIADGARDTFTGFHTQISGDHRYIHKGYGFAVIGNTGSLTAGSGTYSLALTTPVDTAGAYIHFRPANLTATANTMLITVAEGATFTGGSATTPLNLNRNSSTRSLATVTAGVTPSGGITVFQRVVGGGSNPLNNTGGAAGSEHERVLKPGTTYSIKIDNIGATTASTGYFEIYWYEEPKG